MRKSKSRDELSVTRVGETAQMLGGYDILSRFPVGGKNYLLGYSAGSDTPDIYQFLSEKPWVREVGARPKIGEGYDALEHFVMGNRPHLMCYSAKLGAFRIFEVNEDLEFSKPFQFLRSRGEGTTGFTTVKPISVLGQVAFMGYSSSTGRVAIYALSVLAETEDGAPPLRMTCVWSHLWSEGWTRFAFFKLGGGTFFLKTNTVRPNVNIDHVTDGLDGAVPVGTKLDLRHAQMLRAVQPFELEGVPYFSTYEAGGEVTLNRIHHDGRGWTTEAAFKSKRGGAHIVPMGRGEDVLILVT